MPTDPRLKIDINAIDNALLENPSLVQQVCDEAALTVAMRDSKKNDLKTVEAELDAELRESLAKNGKVTEKIVESAVQIHPRREQAFKEWNEASLAAGRADSLVEAVRARSDAIRELSKLYATGYFAIDSTKRSAISEQIQYSKLRERHANQRSQR